MSFCRAAAVADLWPGEMLGVTVAGRKVLLINIAEVIYAYADRCAHLGVPLSQGRLQHTVLTCNAHEWQYDACTGCGINPAHTRLPSYPVRVVDEVIWVDVDSPAHSGGDAQGQAGVPQAQRRR